MRKAALFFAIFLMMTACSTAPKVITVPTPISQRPVLLIQPPTPTKWLSPLAATEKALIERGRFSAPLTTPAPIQYQSAVYASNTNVYPTSTARPYTPRPYATRISIESNGQCTIKGNVNLSTGTWIYHCPNWRDYDITEIVPSEGDRWFCSEAEAKAAGFRDPNYEHGNCRQ